MTTSKCTCDELVSMFGSELLCEYCSTNLWAAELEQHVAELPDDLETRCSLRLASLRRVFDARYVATDDLDGEIERALERELQQSDDLVFKDDISSFVDEDDVERIVERVIKDDYDFVGQDDFLELEREVNSLEESLMEAQEQIVGLKLQLAALAPATFWQRLKVLVKGPETTQPPLVLQAFKPKARRRA